MNNLLITLVTFLTMQASGFDFKFNPSSLKTNAPMFLLGVAGVFVVIGVIVVSTYVLNKVFTKNGSEDE